jgi:hypothetical protein
MPLLQGLYIYTIQGLMHAPKLDPQIDNKGAYLQPGFSGDLVVNLGDFDVSGDQNFKALPAQSPPFLSASVAPKSNPTYPDSTPAGCFPFSEIGYMMLNPDAIEDDYVTPYGKVEGWRIVNTAGYAGEGGVFQGAYMFLGASKPGDVKHKNPNAPVKANLPVLLEAELAVKGHIGYITTQSLDKTNHVWDYVFAMISDGEIQLAANGRLPRPGVATGIMRKANT